MVINMENTQNTINETLFYIDKKIPNIKYSERNKNIIENISYSQYKKQQFIFKNKRFIVSYFLKLRSDIFNLRNNYNKLTQQQKQKVLNHLQTIFINLGNDLKINDNHINESLNLFLPQQIKKTLKYPNKKYTKSIHNTKEYFLSLPQTENINFYDIKLMLINNSLESKKHNLTLFNKAIKQINKFIKQYENYKILPFNYSKENLLNTIYYYNIKCLKVDISFLEIQHKNIKSFINKRLSFFYGYIKYKFDFSDITQN